MYDIDGQFTRSFGTDILRLPGGFLTLGDFMFILDRRGRITVFDADDKSVAHLGDYDRLRELERWPNMPANPVELGKALRRGPDKFSPGGIT